METKNNSEFLSKVNAFQNEAQEFIEKSDKRHAVIVIASEPDENGEGSRQTGSIMGNEEEAVYALAGFMRQPQGRELLKRAAALSMAESLMKSILNAKEQEERKRRLLREFKDCMEIIEGNLLAGYALENAFLDAGKELKELHGEGGLMQTELEIINRKVCMNQPLEIVFEEFAQRCGVEEIQNFSEVLSFAKRSCGNLVGIIQNTVRNISSKIQIEEEIQTMIAQKKLEQKVMNVMPLFLLFYLDITSPGYLNVLYHNVLGVIFMTICLLGYIASVLLSERMGRIEV